MEKALAKLVINPLKEKDAVYIIRQDGTKKKLPIVIKNGKPKITATYDNYLFLTRNLMNIIYPQYIPLSENTEYFIVEEQLYSQKTRVYEIEEVISTIKDIKHKEKEDYKVYETPHKTHEITTRIIAKIIRNTFLIGKENGSYKGIAGFVNKNQLAQTFLEESLTKQDPISHIQEVINQISQKIQKLKESKNTENPEDKNNITNEIDQLKHTLETAEKVKKALELNQKLKDLSLNNKEEIRQLFSIIQENFQLIKELTDNPKLKLAKEFKVAIFDPQAGSGTILDTLKEHNIPSILIGSEIRDIKQEKDGYLVATGIPYEFYYSVLESLNIIAEQELSGKIKLKTNPSTLSQAEARSLTSMFYFINPPYDTNSYHVRNTLKYIPTSEELEIKNTLKEKPTSPIVIGLLSHKEEKILDKYLNAMAIKIKKEDTGYKEENNPEYFLLFVGFNGKNFKLKEYQSISEFEDEVAKWIVNSYGKDLITEMIADQCNHAEKFARKTIELIKEKIQEVKDKNFTVEYLLQPIGLLEKAKRDEAIFPKLNEITPKNGKVKLTNFKELYSDLELQSLYKESMPELYRLFIDTCLATGKEIPSEAEEEEYIITTLEELGIMRFKYIPQRIKITEEVEKAIKEFVNQQEFEKLQMIKKQAKEIYLSIKSMKKTTSKIADNIISTVAVLTISDEKGYDHAIIEIPPEKVFEKLSEKGIINIKAKHISQHPKYKDAYIQLIDKVTKNIIENHEEDIPFILHTIEKYKDLNIVTAEYRIKTMLKNQDLIKRIFTLEVKQEKVIENLENVTPELEKRIKTTIDKINYLLKKRPMQTALSLIDPPEEFPEVSKITKGFSIKDFIYINTNQDVAKEVIEQLYPLAELVKDIGYSIKKLIVAILSSLVIQNHLERKQYKKAIEIFENLHYRYKDGFRLRPYQYESALYGVLKAYLTGKPGHFLGWEMRAGKTLTMASAGYFASMLFDKQTNFFVNTNNVFDIARQIARHLPHVIKQSKIYPTDESDFQENIVETTLSKKAILNPFSPKYSNLYKAKGNSIIKLLQDSPFVKIERYSNNPDTDLENLPKEIKEILKVDYPDKNILKGIALYFNEIKDHLNLKNLGKYIEDLKNIGKKLKYYKESNERMRIISKHKYGYSFSYMLKRDLKFLNKTFTSNANITLQEIDKNYKILETLKEYAVILENSTENSTENYMLKNIETYEDKLQTLAISDKGRKVFMLPVKDYMEIAQEKNTATHTMKTLHNILSNSTKENELDIKKLIYNLGFSDYEIVTIYIPEKIAVNKLIPKQSEKVKQTIIKAQKGTTLSVHIEYDIEKYKHLEIIEGLGSNKSQMVYAFDTINNSIIITDELDTTTNIKTSQLLKLLISIKSPYKLGATGTPTNGYIGDTVGLIGVVSGLPAEVIEKQVEDLNNRYGIKMIDENKGKGLFIILTKYIYQLAENGKAKEVINLIMENQMPREFLINLIKLADESNIHIPETDIDKLKLILNEVLIAKNEEQLINPVMKHKLKWDIRTRDILKKIAKELKGKQVNESSLNSFIIELLEKELENSHILKKEVGTTNPMFVKNINDVSGIQFKSREQLKKVKENLQIIDQNIENLFESYKKGNTKWLTPAESIIFEELEESLRYKYDYLNTTEKVKKARELFKTASLIVQMIERKIINEATNNKEEMVEV
jgi:Tfp pilus assembly protein PilZ